MRANTLIATLTLTGCIFGAGAVCLPAFAKDQAPVAASQSNWMNLQQLQSRLETAGYHNFRKIERDNDKYEVMAMDSQGHRIELYVDPVTGQILKTEIEGSE